MTRGYRDDDDDKKDTWNDERNKEDREESYVQIEDAEVLEVTQKAILIIDPNTEEPEDSEEKDDDIVVVSRNYIKGNLKIMN